MNISYSYYNPYSDDPNDDLYNMAVAINNKNKINDINKMDNRSSKKPVYNNIRDDSLFENDYPYFNTQGEYNCDEIDSGSSSFFSKSYKSKKNIRKNKRKHLDLTDSPDISDDELKLDHIKECIQCKKMFMKLLKSGHVFDTQIIQPVQPIQPTQPIQSIQPIQPTQPIQPIQPIQAIQPIQSLSNQTPVLEQISDTNIINPNQNSLSTMGTKDIILIILVGVAIILILDIIMRSGKRY